VPKLNPGFRRSYHFQMKLRIEVEYDEDARIWVARHDVLGLATEADTMEVLKYKVEEMIPGTRGPKSLRFAPSDSIYHRQHPAYPRLCLKSANLIPALKKLLRDAGCIFVRPGRGDHDIWSFPHN